MCSEKLVWIPEVAKKKKKTFFHVGLKSLMEVIVESSYDIKQLLFPNILIHYRKKVSRNSNNRCFFSGGKNSILIKLGKHISQNQVNYEEFFLLNEFVMGNAIWYFFVRNKMTCFPLPPSHLGAC